MGSCPRSLIVHPLCGGKLLWYVSLESHLGRLPYPPASPPPSIPVIKVELGSAAAAAVAAAHLRGVIRQITIAGVMIDPETVQTKADVGSSETLWSAVLFYNAAKVKAAGHENI